MSSGGRIIAITYSPGPVLATEAMVCHGTGESSNGGALPLLAVALGSRGITMNAVSPGVFR